MKRDECKDKCLHAPVRRIKVDQYISRVECFVEGKWISKCSECPFLMAKAED